MHSADEQGSTCKFITVGGASGTVPQVTPRCRLGLSVDWHDTAKSSAKNGHGLPVSVVPWFVLEGGNVHL